MAADIESYERALDQILALLSQDRDAEALSVVEDLLRRFPFSPYLLVRRACLIQLLDGDEHPSLTLQVARESLEMAQRLAPDYVEPLIELGYFLYAIEDQDEPALKRFEIAREHASRQLLEAMVGEAKCYLDTERPVRAREIAERLVEMFPADAKAHLLRAEVMEHLRPRPG